MKLNFLLKNLVEMQTKKIVRAYMRVYIHTLLPQMVSKLYLNPLFKFRSCYSAGKSAYFDFVQLIKEVFHSGGSSQLFITPSSLWHFKNSFDYEFLKALIVSSTRFRH